MRTHWFMWQVYFCGICLDLSNPKVGHKISQKWVSVMCSACVFIVMCFNAPKLNFSIINLELWLKQTVFCETVEDILNRRYKRFVVCRHWRTTASNFKFYRFDTVVLSSEVIRELYSSTLFFPLLYINNRFTHKQL